MTEEIKKTAVLGAGRMGSAIAAHLANAGADVLLLDIVPKDAGNRRSKRAEDAVEKMKEEGRAFTHPGHARRIVCGNLEDDMERLRDCDWIVEAVVENIEVKKNIFERVDKNRNEESVVSSNTSTIPLAVLKEGQSERMKDDLFITHFFNPPRQMRLLELVAGNDSDLEKMRRIENFADRRLGKTVIQANDTPGFIGNRIGLFWMLTGLQQALEMNIPVPMADDIFGKKLGFPKTGIFGLFDVVGVSLMENLARTLRDLLPGDDRYQGLDEAMDFLKSMKGKNFYKKDESGKRVPLNLQSGNYEQPAPYVVAEMLNLKDILAKDAADAAYALAVLLRTLNYACAVLPDIADNVLQVDAAMRLGFNWRSGPFEMIDSLGAGESGTDVLIEALERQDLIPAPVLQRMRGNPFYQEQAGRLYYFRAGGGYAPKTVAADKWQLADIARGHGPVLQNEHARLWDVGGGIAAFALTTKMGTIGLQIFDLLQESIEKVESDFAGLIIGHDDAHFSVGLDLHVVLNLCERGDWDAISRIVRTGQQAMAALKYAPFPVVGAPFGRALGGACEMMLHCDGIQAYSESQIGLVETRIGLVPAWGGCKEMLASHLQDARESNSELQACETVFTMIADAKTSSSAEEFHDMAAKEKNIRITMNRERLLSDAKSFCEELARDYSPPKPSALRLPQAAVKSAYDNEIQNRAETQNLSAYDRTVLECLAHVLSGGAEQSKPIGDMQIGAMQNRMKNNEPPLEITEQRILDLEHGAFMHLIRNEETQEKIRKVL